MQRSVESSAVQHKPLAGITSSNSVPLLCVPFLELIKAEAISFVSFPFIPFLKQPAVQTLGTRYLSLIDDSIETLS